jgi:hypothetical protein
MSTNITEFSNTGLNLGKNDRNLTYLYGVSDFWAYMFEDTETVNLLLECNAMTASEVYNNFLQLTTGLSLDNIQAYTNSQIKLIFLKLHTDSVEGSTNTFKLPTEFGKLYSTKHITNRPLLPTEILEDKVDYNIDPQANTITFAKALQQYSFPFRYSTGNEPEFAIWFVDVKIENEALQSLYANTIGVFRPTVINEIFKNFLYGLYYIYNKGPIISLIRKGMDLAVGIPLARDNESILEIRHLINTDEWMVITDLNSYIIPYGLKPTVEVGDELKIGDSLSNWVEVKDYESDGAWWLNFAIPSFILPDPPNLPSGSYASEGTYADWIMRTYLKKHTFLVNIKVDNFKVLQNFSELINIIKYIKPTYTTPIYVWTISIPDEILKLDESEFYLTANLNSCEWSMTMTPERFFRGYIDPDKKDEDLSLRVTRGCPQFIRFNAPDQIRTLIGIDPEKNGPPRVIGSGIIKGYANRLERIRPNTELDEAWLRVFSSRYFRGQYFPRRNIASFTRSMNKRFAPGGDLANSSSGLGINRLAKQVKAQRVIFLYNATYAEVKAKFNFPTILRPYPEKGYVFTLLEPEFSSDAINEHVINGTRMTEFSGLLRNNFSLLFLRASVGATIFDHEENGKMVYYGTSRYGNLGPIAARDSYYSYTPSPLDIREGDFMVFVRSNDSFCGVFWATSNLDVDPPPFVPIQCDNALELTRVGTRTREAGTYGHPFYMVRGVDNSINAVPDPSPINTKIIDGEGVNGTLITSGNSGYGERSLTTTLIDPTLLD